MSYFSWLRKMFPRASKSSPRPLRPRFLPIPEQLETRAVPAMIVTAPTNGQNLSADLAANASGGGAFTTLNDIVLTEGANRDFKQNESGVTIVFSAPTGWNFEASTGNVGFTAGRDITAASIGVTTTTITVTYTTGNGMNFDALTISGINVQAAANTSGAGSIFRTGGTATLTGVVNDSTNFASLSQVPGAAAQFAFTTAPFTIGTTQTSPTITVQLRDQFGTVTNAGGGGQTVDLLTSSAGGTFRDDGDTTDITSVVVSSGSSTADFRYKDNDAGNPTITASFSGFTSATQVETVTVANAAPTITGLALSSATVDEGSDATLTVNFSDADVSDTHTATINWGDSAPSVAAVTSGQVFTHTYADGPNDFTVSATVADNAGGTSSPATVDVSVANVAASISAADLATASIDEGGEASLTVSFSDPGDDTHDATIAWGDGDVSTVTAVTSGQVFTHTYADGPNSFSIFTTITDSDGADSAISTTAISIANVAPSISAADLATATVDEGSEASLTVSFSDPGDDSHDATIAWGDGDVSTVTAVTSGQVFTHVYADGPGAFTILTTVTDDDGADSSIGTTNISVANVAPSISAADLASASIGEGSEASLTVTFSDPGDDTHDATIAWGDGDVSTVTAVTSGQVFTHVYADGPNAFSISTTITDSDGADSSISTTTISVGNVAPSISAASLAAASISEGDTASLTVNFSDPGDDSQDATIAWGDGSISTVTAVTSGQVFTHTYADGPSSFSIFTTVTDSDGADSAISTTNISIGNVAPSISAASLAAASINEGSTASLTVNFSDPGDDTFTATINWGDSAPSVVPGVSSGQVFTHVYGDGPSAFTVNATITDSDGDSSSASTNNISVGNVAPSLSAANLAATVDEGSNASLTLSFSDPANANDTYTATINWGDSAPSVVAGVTSGQVFTHVYADGPSAFTVNASIADSDGASSSTSTNNISVANVAPSITALSPASATVGIGDTVSLAVNFTDPANANDTYTATINWGDTTSSVAVVTSGQVLTHLYGSTGTFSVNGTVQDEDGGTSAVASVDLSVTNVGVIVTAATGGTGISADLAADATGGGAFTTLGNIVLTEQAGTDFANGQTNATLILTAPTGWTFNVGVGTVAKVNGNNITDASIDVASSTITVTFTTNTVAAKIDTLTISGIQVQATSGVLTTSPAGNILRTSGNPGTGSILGIVNDSTNFGSLSQVAGAATQFAFTTSPFIVTTGQTSPPITVEVQDQFDNTTTAGLSGQTVNLSTSSGGGAFRDLGDTTNITSVVIASGSSDASFRYVDSVTGNPTITASFAGLTSATQVETVGSSNTTITTLALSGATVGEGSTVSATVSFTDPDGGDTFTATINWGDSTVSSVNNVTSGQVFTHVYVEGPNAFTVTAAVGDQTGAASSISTVDVAVTNVAPSISALSLAAATIAEGGTATLTVNFGDPGALDTHTATINWGDGSSAVTSVVTTGQTFTHDYVDNLAATINVTVTDDDGGSDSESINLAVTNAAPAITSLVLAGATIAEGGTATLTVNFTDAGVDDTHTATINWGDGASAVTAAVTSGQTFTHAYTDNFAPASITVTVRDNDNATDSESINLAVTNVAPSISAVSLSAPTIAEGGTSTLTVNFTDAGSSDTHTATISWGDGTSAVTAAVTSGQTFTHGYTDNFAPASITVTVRDDDNGTDSESINQVVTNVAPDITDVDLTPTIGQNGTATLDVAFTDPGSADTHTATITWGDGATSILPVTSGQSFTHQYTATANPASVTVVVTDDDGGSDTTGANIVVQPFVIDAVNDTATVVEDTTLSASGNVLGNDTVTGGTATVTAVNGSTANVGDPITGTFGVVTINGDGTFVYTLDNDAAVVQALAGGGAGSDTFTYSISNGLGGSDTATLTVNVGGTNDAPVIDDSGNPFLTPQAESNGTNNGALVSDLIASAGGDLISDVDTGAVEGIAITGVNTNAESFTPVADDFDRGTLGDAYTTQVGAGFTLNGTTAAPVGFSMVVLDDVVHTNLAVQADVTVGASGSFAGLVARYNGVGDNNLYLATLANVGGVVTADVWKNVAGVYTKLSTSAPLGTNAGTLRFEIVGNNLRVFFNGVLRTEISDSSLAGAGRIGLRASGGTFDNLLVEPATVPTVNIDDDFDRAAVGPDYTTQVGAGFAISGNRLTSMGFSLATNNKAGSKTDVAVTVDVTLNGSGSFAGVVTRYAGPGDTNLYLGTMANNGTNNVAEIWKNVGGAYTKLTSQVIPSGTGTLKFETLGSVLTLSIDGVVRGQVFDTSLVNGGFIGVRGSNGTTFDNLKIRNASLGTWQFSTDDGTSWTDIGDVSESSRRLLASDANTRVRFLPKLGAASSAVVPSLQFRAWDQTQGTNGDLLATSDTGGSSAFSTGTEFATEELFVTDSFTAAFATGWQTQVAGATVSGNQVISTTGLAVSTYNAFTSADVLVEADVTAPSSGNFVGVLGRYQGPGDTNTYAGFLVNVGGQGFAEIWKNVGGTWTKLTSTATATAGSLRLEIFGTTLKLFFNDVLVGTAQDSSIAAAGVTGIRLGSGGPTIDDFVAARLEAPSGDEYSDDFNRANSASLGSNYNEINDGATIVGGQVQFDAFSLVAVKNQFVRDVSAEVDVTLTPDASNVAYAGIAVRHAGASDSNMYWAGIVQVGANFSVQLWKAAPNFTSPLATAVLADGTGRLRVEALGSSLKVFVDGVLQISVNDTSLTGAGFVSLRGFKATLDDLDIDVL